MPERAPHAAALVAALLLALPVSAFAADPVPAATVTSQTRQVADAVVAYLTGKLPAEAIFAPSFLATIPPEKLAELRDQLVTQLGAPRGYDEWHDSGAGAGHGLLDFARGRIRVELRHAPAPPHRITELLFKPAPPAADGAGPAALLTDFAALPGLKGFAAYRLAAGGPSRLFGTAETPVLPLGSLFKLWVLAELDAEIRDGSHRWSDVVTLEGKSIPSGILQDWPDRAPLTLHSLAALMISISDNSATDLLIDTLGRDRITDRAVKAGWIDAAATLPLLKTVETAALKSPQGAPLAKAWAAASRAERDALLRDHRAALTRDAVDVAALSGAPVHSGTIEWFADADMLARLANWLVHHASAETRAILAINPGMVARDGWAWVGYKGGSEPGVLAAAHILCRDERSCFALIAQWHDPEKPVDLTRLSLLVNRAAAQLPKD